MADYRYMGFDTYGYVENVEFTPLEKECGVEYENVEAQEPTLTEVESFVCETYPEQEIIAVPKNKCLRK